MNRHSTNPWARLRVLLMLPAVTLAILLASACKDDAGDSENIKAEILETVELETAPLDTINGVIGHGITPEDVAFMVVEDMPEFKGGTEALLEYLRENLEYPERCKQEEIQGRVIVTFVIDKDGSIVEPEVVKSVDPDLDAEALRVVSQMPAWNPGKQAGKEVRVRYTVPVTFRLK